MSSAASASDATEATSGRPRRRGCIALVGLWVCVAAISVVVALLLVRGDLAFGRPPLRHTRVWLVQEEGNRGLGLSSTRPLSGSEDTGAVCVETGVRFVLWQAAQPPERVRYCECYEREAETWHYAGTCDD